MDNQECPICYEETSNIIDFTNCDHHVCSTCHGKLRSSRCPLCRADISDTFTPAQQQSLFGRQRQDRQEDFYLHFHQTLEANRQNLINDVVHEALRPCREAYH